MAFPQFAELWKLIDLLVRKDFRQANLALNEFQRSLFHVASVEEVFPEYYILKVNKFDDVARDGLDQWVYFLKNGSIKPSFTGKGLKEAQNALDVTEAFDSERRAYESYVDAQRIDIGVAQSTVLRAEAAEARAEEADVKNERNLANALKALISRGMSEQEARKTLGLD
jgi:hypothetical protein